MSTHILHVHIDNVIMHAMHHDLYCLEINVSIMLQAGSTNQDIAVITMYSVEINVCRVCPSNEWVCMWHL